MLPRKFFRISLRNFIVCISALGLFLAVLVNRQSYRRDLIRQLNDEAVQFETSWEQTNWFDRLPLVGAGDAIVSVSFWYDSKLNPETINRLNSIGTVSQLSYVDSIGTRGVEMISLISTIESIDVAYYVTAEHVAPFRNHRLVSYSVSGADVYPSPEAIKILYSIPTLKTLGTAHGEFDVPDQLRRKRPDIEVEMTDFPA